MGTDTDVNYEPCSRRNGWSLPPHPLQFVSWGCVIYFLIIYFTTMVPGLPLEWQPAGYIIQGLASVSHIITHIVASTINPADPAVLKKQSSRPAKFDRQRHKHVIENQHCYLCDVNVGPKSKHCSACNKCVSDFDHHCKWLNNCVGGRNYRWFLGTLLTAIFSCLLLLVISLLQFTAYYTDRENGVILQQYKDYLASNNSSSSSPVFSVLYQPVSDEGWQAVIAITGILAFIGFGLLLHLLCFHIYLICKGISTYDFIVMQRESLTDASESRSPEDGRNKTAKGKRNKIAPSSGKGAIELKDRSMEDSFKAKKKQMKTNKESLSDYTKAVEDSDGETPPPAPSPPAQTASLPAQNSSTVASTNSVKKKKKRKKKKPPPAINDQELIATIDKPEFYRPRGFEGRRIEVPISPVMIHRSAEFASKPPTIEEYHSESAESLVEIPPGGSYQGNTSLQPLVFVENDSKHSANGVLSLGDGNLCTDGYQGRIKNGGLAARNLPCAEDTVIGASGHLTENDSSMWPSGKPTLRRAPLAPIPPPQNIPPLDLSALRTSTDSTLSYKPYSGLRSASDTFRPFEPFEPSEKTLTETALEV